MKKCISLLISIIMILSVFSGFCLYGEEESTVNIADYDTSIPVEIFDMADGFSDYIGQLVNCDTIENDTGIKFVANGEDPNAQFGVPESKPSELAYMKVNYKLSIGEGLKRWGEIYWGTEEKPLAEASKIFWQWKNDNNTWGTQIIPLRNFSKADDDFVQFRFDPLSSNYTVDLSAGESVEIQYMAFFSSKDDAEKFNYENYKKYLSDLKNSKKKDPTGEDYKFEKPEYKEIAANEYDNTEGTVNFKTNSDGTYTLSYEVNGEKYSYTVPDTNQMKNGPLAGTDDLGRTINNQYTVIEPDYTCEENEKVTVVDGDVRTVGVYGENGEHYVGIFYFLWHSPGGWGKAHNVESILEEYGERAYTDSSLWGNVYDAFYFAEPLYGYYNSSEEWIIRKHLELLSNAGVDFLYFDTTNNYAYTNVVTKIVKICHELNEEGFNAPKIVFYTNTDAKARVQTIYDAIYKNGEYKDTWLYVDGKPLIIAPYEANIDDFFTIRVPQWPNTSKVENSWPWIDWNWPQEIYSTDGHENEAISVSVAQHSGNGNFSASLLYGYKYNRGRSFNGYYNSITSDSYKLGTNLQNEFNRAITAGSKYVLVTGWNEWVACRQQTSDTEHPVVLIDTISYEYSRDIEMSKGGYFDNYYMQLVSNITSIKGAAPTIVRDDRHQINVTGDFSQWDEVLHSYTDYENDNEDRSSMGAITGTKYEDYSGRNDITSVKVTNDSTWLHFLVTCSENIVKSDDGTPWLQIYLNADRVAETGWYGYDYILNYNAKNDNKTSLARFSGADSKTYGFTETLELDYQVEGNQMMISVPLENIGVEYFNRINIEFKVFDSRTAITSMEQFYTEGDSAPLGRLNYVYQTYIPDVSYGEVYKVITLADREEGKEEPDVDVEKKKNKGCGSVLGGFGAACLAGAIGVLSTKHKAKSNLNFLKILLHFIFTGGILANAAILRRQKI